MQTDCTIDPLSASASLSEFIQAVQQRTEPILAIPRRCRKELPPNFTPHRRFRIAKADRGLNSELKAKQVLLRQLGLMEEGATMTNELLAKYAFLFERPLSENVVMAFANFYGWSVPGAAGPGSDTPRAMPRLVEA